MTQKAQPSFVITANRLSDGAVLYLAAASTWVLDLGHAHDRLLAFAKSCELTICGPYALEIAHAPDGARLLSARERLRALGASDVRRRLGY